MEGIIEWPRRKCARGIERACQHAGFRRGADPTRAILLPPVCSRLHGRLHAVAAPHRRILAGGLRMPPTKGGPEGPHYT